VAVNAGRSELRVNFLPQQTGRARRRRRTREHGERELHGVHGNTSRTMTSNSHPAHLTTLTGAGAVCDDCQRAGSVATHINGS